ncbi:secreted RxLR effector protein 161-like [Nicotiana tabacum]|uniref:Secreted RxLR effector protein 161-like n=1 Tax=Nicotiana tabacum TaxID=4097 RepID=A0AC58UI24_TOBAC
MPQTKDDILIAGNDKEFITKIKSWLSSQFKMKDMGEAAYILGVKISRDRPKKLLYLSQENYIRKVLERFIMQNSSPIENPISKVHTLGSHMCPKTPKETERMSRVPYRSAVGSLIYAMVCTRPDICKAVSLVSRYQTDPGLPHWQVVKRIMRYLKGTTDYALCYRGNKDLRLVGYSDVDHRGYLDMRKSTSGYVFLLNDGAISWSSKKQSCVSLSMMEAKYVALALATQEAVWLKKFLDHLLDITENTEPVLV